MPTLGYLPYQGWAFKSSPSLGHRVPTAWSLPPHRLVIASPTLGHRVPNIVVRQIALRV